MLVNVFYILAAILLVILNGFFVAAEFALVKLRHTQAAGLAERIGWRGRILLSVHERLDAYLSACQLGITLASLGLGWIGEPAFATLLEPLLGGIGGLDPATIHVISFIFAFTLISFLHIVLGELAPKSLAIRRPEHTSAWTATPLYVFYWIMYPAIWLLNGSANLMLRVFGLDTSSGHEHHYTREELKLILHGNRAMRDSSETFAMMSHALDLPELVAGDLLRTRDQLGALHDGQGQQDVLTEIRRSQFSRYPWFDAGFEQVRGILHVKDVLLALAENPDL
jgi:CBS domain containing-hemolysin-like protein